MNKVIKLARQVLAMPLYFVGVAAIFFAEMINGTYNLDDWIEK